MNESCQRGIPRLLWAVVVLGAATVLSTAHATDRDWRAYREVCERLYLDKFMAVPRAQRDHLSLGEQLEMENIDPTTVTFTIAARAQSIVVRPDAQGNFEIPFNDELMRENPRLLTNLPENVKPSMALRLIPRMPQDIRFSYADLMVSVDQANKLIRMQAGLLSFVVPKLKAIVLHFERPSGQHLSIRWSGGERTLTADDKGYLRIPFDADLLARNPMVELSERAMSADLDE